MTVIITYEQIFLIVLYLMNPCRINVSWALFLQIPGAIDLLHTISAAQEPRSLCQRRKFALHLRHVSCTMVLTSGIN